MEILQYEFMRNALIGGLLAAVACGVTGSFIVARRIVFLSGGIAHASFGGVGLGYLLKFPPLAGAIVFGVLSGLSMGLLTRRTREREDTSIGIIWAVGMGLGIVFVSLAPGYAPDLMTYLFGNILSVTRADLWLMAGLDLFILLAVILMFRELRAAAFDEEFAQVRGLPVLAFYLFLLVLVALTVVLLMKTVGVILVIALLTLPAAAAGRYACTLKSLMVLSTIFSAGFILAGLVLSWWLDLPSGATIILTAGAVFLLTSARKHPAHGGQ